MLWVREVVRRYRSDPDNPWNKIRLNPHVDPNYPPTIPLLSKKLGGDQDLDVDFTTYMDDS